MSPVLDYFPFRRTLPLSVAPGSFIAPKTVNCSNLPVQWLFKTAKGMSGALLKRAGLCPSFLPDAPFIEAVHHRIHELGTGR